MRVTDRWRTISGFIRVGRLGTTHGAQGEIKLIADEAMIDDIGAAEFLFVDIDGDRVPFEVAGFRITKDLLVQFHSLEDQGAASRLTGSEVFLPEEEVQSSTSETLPSTRYSKLVGMEMHDSVHGNLGEILEVRVYPEQELAVLELNGHEVLIPLHDDLILDVDSQSNVVEVDLPEGLLDLNLD